MDKGLPIRIEPVRGRLPWRYLDDPPRKQAWRWLGLVCLAMALFWGSVYWWASR